MTKNTEIKQIQIRIGKKTDESLKEWFFNQKNPNESARKVLEHFIRVYGTYDINSNHVQVLMAKEILEKKGNADISIQPAIKNHAQIDTNLEEPIESPNHEEKANYKSEIVKQKQADQTEKAEQSSNRPILSRGKIDV